jgi:glycine/D-amino acid oxidase-like deaminating enzyme
MQPDIARHIDPRFAYDAASIEVAIADLRRMFPTFREVGIEAAWGGPIDVSGDHLPFFGTLDAGTVHYGLGYTGNGVDRRTSAGGSSPSRAREVRRRARPAARRLSRAGSHRSRSGRWAAVANRAIHRRDESLDDEEDPNPFVDFVAKLPEARLQPRSMTALPRQARVSWWMEEARPALDPEPQPTLSGDATADVVILGGGYTGLWTAWFLTERDPGCDVVLLESDELCGSGPSGRNGGFCYGMWEDLEALVRVFGETDALRVAETAQRSVGRRSLARRERGRRMVQPRRAPDDRDVARAGRRVGVPGCDRERLGVGERFVELDAEAVQERCRSPVFRGGLLQPDNATLQPARLALGPSCALARGVRIHESSPVTRFREGPPSTSRPPPAACGPRAGSSPSARGRRPCPRSVDPCAAGHLHRGHRACARPARRDRLDRRRGTGGLADRPPLLPDDARRAYRLRRRRGDRRAGVGLGPRLRHDPPSIVKLVDDFGGSSRRGPT